MSLYEIDYHKEYIGDKFDTYKTGTRTYQVVADNEYDACAVLGQIYNDEDFIIHIETVKVV